MIKIVGVSAVVASMIGMAANAAPLSPTAVLRPGGTIVRTGHLEGASAPGFVMMPYADGISDQLCSPSACVDVRVHLTLPSRKFGDLVMKATAPTKSAGLNMRLFDEHGNLLATAGAGGVGVGAPASNVSVESTVRHLPAGNYVVRLYLSAGIADYTETLKLRAARKD